jgi:glycosyltransferase involved in cell wall biosynthesis
MPKADGQKLLCEAAESMTLTQTVAHFGNMANDAFPIVEELQALGENVELYISLPTHVTALPQWELLRFEMKEIGDPYSPNMDVLNRGYTQPKWVHFFSMQGNTLSRLHRLRKKMRRYDLIVAHVPFFLYSYLFRMRYIPFEAGSIRYFNQGVRLRERLRFWFMEQSYRHARLVLMTNPDTLDLCERYRLNWRFIPFAINMERYSPMKVENLNYENVILCFSRHVWAEKGQDKLIKAFAKFVKEHKDSLLVFSERGEDLAKSRALISRVGIEKSVQWLPLMSKPYLVEWINKSTVVADQFNLGSSGTAGFEAMACEKPLIIYLSRRHFNRLYKEFPPILNARTEEEILQALNASTDKKYRQTLGRKSRLWTSKYHDAAVVAKQHLAIYKQVLGDR